MTNRWVENGITSKKQKEDEMMAKTYDVTGAIIAFEGGELNEKETIELFQHLVDTGMAWQLQGSYGRQAKAMLDAGVIHKPKKKTTTNNTDYYGNKIFRG